jgi:ribosome recycling factor
MEVLKKAKLSEDETKRTEKEIQTLTDKFIKDINDAVAAKEKELLAV